MCSLSFGVLNAVNKASSLRGSSAFGKISESKNLVDKILKTKNTLQSQDLNNQTFSNILSALKDNGINDVRIIARKNGGYIVNVPNIKSEGIIGLFPGEIMSPGHNLNVSFKFNEFGDCVQLTGVQKQTNAVAGSTIRTKAGVDALRNSGVSNPTEYVQVYSPKSVAGRYVNKTSAPYGTSLSKSKETAEIVKDTVAKEAQNIAGSVNSLDEKFKQTLEMVRKIDPKEAEGIENTLKRVKLGHDKRKQAFIDRFAGKNTDAIKAEIEQANKRARLLAQEKEERGRMEAFNYMLNDLREINPDLAQKVSDKLSYMARHNSERAYAFRNGLVERYSNGLNDINRFKQNTGYSFMDDITGFGSNKSSYLDDISDFHLGY